jgi:hypothetical protein
VQRDRVVIRVRVRYAMETELGKVSGDGFTIGLFSGGGGEKGFTLSDMYVTWFSP